jgi:hypothetical protein
MRPLHWVASRYTFDDSLKSLYAGIHLWRQTNRATEQLDEPFCGIAGFVLYVTDASYIRESS